MTVRQLAKVLNATIIAQSDLDKEVTGGYAGDLLSFVMGRAMPNCAWYTIMTNINVCAVATLTDCAVVVLCEGVEPDAMLVSQANIRGVNIIATQLDIYTAIEQVTKNN